MNSRLYTFLGGLQGDWSITSSRTLAGEPLPAASRVQILQGNPGALPPATAWVLSGTTSNERYVTRPEKIVLVSRQANLGRPAAACAALIPIRKSPAWWNLSQDERRAIFEERSHHIAIGLKYLPNVARRLHHCRDLAEPQPFDFVTLFDFAPSDAAAFDEMLVELRSTEEWKYVDREIDIRLLRDTL